MYERVIPVNVCQEELHELLILCDMNAEMSHADTIILPEQDARNTGETRGKENKKGRKEKPKKQWQKIR